jgi:hypothetical protein
MEIPTRFNPKGNEMINDKKAYVPGTIEKFLLDPRVIHGYYSIIKNEPFDARGHRWSPGLLYEMGRMVAIYAKTQGVKVYKHRKPTLGANYLIQEMNRLNLLPIYIDGKASFKHGLCD